MMLLSSSNVLSVISYYGSSIVLPYTSSPSWFFILNAIEFGILLLILGDNYSWWFYFLAVCFFWIYGDISSFDRLPANLCAFTGDYSTLETCLIDRLLRSSFTSSSIAMLLNSSRRRSKRPLASLIMDNFYVWDFRDAVKTMLGKINYLLLCGLCTRSSRSSGLIIDEGSIVCSLY